MFSSNPLIIFATFLNPVKVENNSTPYSFAIASVKDFIDEIEYTVFAYGDVPEGEAYPLVLVTAASGSYTSKTNFAIVASTPSAVYDEASGEECVSIELLYKGEELTGDFAKKFNSDWWIDDVDLSKGDVIVFTEDNNGYIKDYDVLVKARDIGLDNGYDAVLDNSFENSISINIPMVANNWTTSWTIAEDEYVNHERPVTRLVYGPVVDKRNSYFTLGSIGDGEVQDYWGDVIYDGLFTDLTREGSDGGIMEISTTADTNVYVYDFSKSSKYQLDLGMTADIIPNVLAKSQYLNDGDLIPWIDSWEGDTMYGTTFAFVKVVDDIATDVYVILSE